PRRDRAADAGVLAAGTARRYPPDPLPDRARGAGDGGRAALPAPAARRGHGTEPGMSALAAGDTGHILVVDDNEMNRDVLSRRLLRQGHTVDMAVDGREALGLIEAGDYDLVLLDIMMPVMNGFELLERLRGDDRFRHLPIVMISALDDAESITKAIGMGADDHLPTPFTPQSLRGRVGAGVARKRLHDREQMSARALEREIDIARDIQAGFLPAELPRADGWELAACFEPARQVGGDFYDAFALEDGRIALVVADVCDKGVGAALF